MDIKILKDTLGPKVYNFNNYKKIINFIRNKKYKFARFDRENSFKKIYLRHDIDLSPKYLINFLKFYDENNISANIFFMVNSKTYNLLEKKNIDFINKISKRHCLGLHIDLAEIKKKEIKNHINFFKRYLKISNVISFHRPKKIDLINAINNKKYLNAYDKKFFDKNNYVSDSGQKKNFCEKLFKIVSNKNNPIQFLVHPIWWQNKIYKKDIEKILVDDQIKEVNDYYNLNNFFNNI